MIFTPEQIIKVAQRLEKLTDAEASAIIDQIQNEQPFVLGYAIATGESFEDPADAEGLTTLVVLIWMVFKEFFPEIKTVDQALIQQTEDKHFEELKSIEGKEGEEFQLALLTMAGKRPQPALSDFLNQEVVHSFTKDSGTAFALMNVLTEVFDTASKD